MNYFSFKSRTYLIATIAALMIAVNLLEMFIVLPIPLFKIGLANILPVYFIAKNEYKFTLIVNILRVLIVNLISGKLFSFLFLLSLSGILISTLSMIFLKFYLSNKVSCLGLSVAGSVTNNVTQYFFFLILLNADRISVFQSVNSLFSSLIILSILSGSIIGFLASNLPCFYFIFPERKTFVN